MSCDQIKLAKIPKDIDEFRMIKIEFNPIGSWDSDVMNIAEYADYTGVEFKSKNLESKQY